MTTDHNWRDGEAVVNGLRLHYVETGDGPLVVLLHGFPEFWYAWQHQIPALASAGFRVVAPDLRGYHLSDKPTDVASYRMSLLVEDVAGLIRHFGAERANVVAHDWGGVIAWKLALARPDLVDRLAILNSPHPAALRRELHGLAQWFRSAYVLFFQLPRLPEWVILRDGCAFLDKVLSQTVRRGAFSSEDVNRYKAALSMPGAATAALNYYRAAMRYPNKPADDERPITTPTLLIWGERDRYLGVRLSEGLGRWVRRLRVARLRNASHWVQNDDPERVNALLLDFLRER